VNVCEIIVSKQARVLNQKHCSVWVCVMWWALVMFLFVRLGCRCLFATGLALKRPVVFKRIMLE
jgi:purine-cytosine permease-like protein